MRRGISDFEKRMLNKFDETGMATYHTYLFYVKSTYSLMILKERYLKDIEQNRYLRTIYPIDAEGRYYSLEDDNFESAFSIRDIKDQDSDTKISYIGNTLSAIRRSIYNPESMYLTTMQVFTVEEDEYVCILTYCDILSYTTEATSFLSHLNLRVKNQRIDCVATEKCKAYYKDMFRSMSYSISGNTELEQMYIEKECFPIKTEMIDILRKQPKSNLMTIRNMIISIWGIVLGRAFSIPEIISGDRSLQSKVLPMAIIKQSINRDFKSILVDTVEQVKKSTVYNECTKKDLEAISGKKLSEIVSVIHDFSEIEPSKIDLRGLGEGLAYEFAPEIATDATLNITYIFLGNDPQIEYHYDRRVFDSVSIKDLHDTVTATLNSLVSKAFGIGQSAPKKDIADVFGNMKRTDISEVEQKKSVNTDRMFNEKLAAIKEVEIFSVCTETEKEYLANNSYLKTFMLGQNIVIPNIRFDSIWLVVSGKISDERLDKDGYISPLQILKDKEMFGFESLYEPYVSEDIYTVASKQAIMLEIPIQTLKTIYLKHPGVLISMLKIVGKRLNKFKTLWLMS